MKQRPLWAWLFFPQLAVVLGASVLASTGHFPVAAFQRWSLDKLGHLLAYGGLSFFAVSFFGGRRCWPVVLVLAAAATGEELSQRLFPARTFDLGDLAMNLAGIGLLGAAAARPRPFTRLRSRVRG